MNKTLIVAICAAFLAPLANAEHGVGRCDSEGAPALGIVEVGGGSAETTFYVDDRNYALANGIWIYAESNGVWTSGATGHDNLQRGGASPFVPDDNEVCTDESSAGPDLLIF